MVLTFTNGIVTGAVYGLVAVGLVLLYKGSGVLNFAHGDIGMIGAFLFYVLWVEQRWPYPLAAVIGVLASGAVSALARVILHRQVDSPLNMLIGTLGVAGLLQFTATEVWGPDPRFLRSPFDGHRLDLGPVHVIGARLAVVAVAIVISAALFLFLRGTFGGVLFRAVAGDRYTARLMGVNVGRFDTVLWTVSGMLAGAAAIAVAPLVNFGVFFMSLLLLRAFGAAVLGGMTSVLGCLVAGIAIGIGEAVLTRELHVPGIGEVVVAGVVIAALASRPAALAR